MKHFTTGILSLLVGLLIWTASAFAQAPAVIAGTADAASTAEAGEPVLDELIGVLGNEEARAQLLESLKAAAYRAPDAVTEQPATSAVTGSDIVRTLPGRVADYSRAFIESVGETLAQLAGSARSSLDLLSGAGSLDLPRLIEAILPVGLVALVVFSVLGAGRLVKHPIFRRLAHSAEHAGPIRKLFLLLASGLVDALSIVLSWAAGYVAGIIFFGGSPGFNQTLFLNAFLLIEMIKVALGTFVAPQYPKLRLTPFGNTQASYWYFWISRLISILGYTFMFVAPIVQRSSTLAAADAVRFVVVLISLALTIGLILKNRGPVRERLKRSRHRGDNSLKARFYAFLGQIWWALAILFVLSLFLVWLRSPETGLTFMVAATLKSIAAMAVGGLAVSILSRGIARGIPIPAGAKDRLPLLERRVNSFIPNALTVIRVLVVVCVVGLILEAWSLFDFQGWARTEIGQRFIGGVIGAGVVVVLGFAIFLGVSSWVEYRLNPNYGTVPTARERTLLALFRNAFTVTLAVIVIMLVLSQIGIDIAPLLAGAGVVGLAVGFGAQKLVQDIITGAFIQLENAMNEGDVVQLAGVSGVVERLTIRSVGLRSLDGIYHLIPFSSVDQVANMTKDFSQFVADIAVAYRENTDDVKTLMRDAFDLLRAGEQGVNVIADFEMMGVDRLADSSVIVRGRIKTLPGKQWSVGRAYNEIAKRLCDERDIELAFPQMSVWFGQDKRGNAPPVHLAAPASDAQERPAVEAAARRTADGRR